MSKFEIGDRVRVVDQYTSCNEVGDVGTIVNVNTESTFQQYKVQVKGRSTIANWSYEESLELVEETPSEKTKEIDVYVDGMYFEEENLIYGNHHEIHTKYPTAGALKAKLIIDLPEKKVELTEYELKYAVEDYLADKSTFDTLKKELGF